VIAILQIGKLEDPKVWLTKGLEHQMARPRVLLIAGALLDRRLALFELIYGPTLLTRNATP
jgi:hypothetical protein